MQEPGEAKRRATSSPAAGLGEGRVARSDTDGRRSGDKINIPGKSWFKSKMQ